MQARIDNGEPTEGVMTVVDVDAVIVGESVYPAAKCRAVHGGGPIKGDEPRYTVAEFEEWAKWLYGYRVDSIPFSTILQYKDHAQRGIAAYTGRNKQ
jgi:hypothetical protein